MGNVGLKTQWRAESEFTPAESVFGSQPLLPGQFLGVEESLSPSFLAEFKAFSPRARLSGARIMLPLVPALFQKSCCYPGLCWFATTACSRICRRCTTARTWFWRDLSTSSKSSWGLEQTPSRHTGSRLAMCPLALRPPYHLHAATHARRVRILSAAEV